MEKGQIRRKKKPAFTIVPNQVLQMVTLSWKAKGLMSYLLSLPDNWDIYKSELVSRSTDGYDSMISAWKELENAGFIETIQLKNGSLFSGYEYVLHEVPIGDFPEPDSPEPENPRLINTKSKASTSRSTKSNLNINVDKSTSAHHRIIKHFFDVLHPSFVFGAIHAKTVKELILKTKTLLKKAPDRVVDEQSIGDFMIKVLDNLPEYYKEKDLAVINSKFNEIISEIKNNIDGKQPTVRPTAYTAARESADKYNTLRNSG